MSSISFGKPGSSASKLRKQKFSREADNSLTVVELRECNEADFPAILPALQTAHGTYSSTFLNGSIPAENVGGGLIHYTLTYKGFDSSGGITADTSPPRYWFEGSDETRPITELHDGRPNTFADIVTAALAQGLQLFDAAGNFLGLPKGLTVSGDDISQFSNFLDVGGSWNCERFSSTAPDVGDGCKIDPTPPGSPPDLSATLPDAQWLYLTPSYEKLATAVFKVRQRWLLFPQGVSSAIYDTL